MTDPKFRKNKGEVVSLADDTHVSQRCETMWLFKNY